MNDPFFRTKLLIGKQAFEKLQNSKIAVFGVGGVGTFVIESLVRCGIGQVDIFDGDKVEITNINRQLIADRLTIGQDKVRLMKERALKISPSTVVNAYSCFFNETNENEYSFEKYDYVVDCIDDVSAKVLIISKAKKAGVRVISSMGTGNKIDPLKLEVTDIYKTLNCPLARVMRRRLKLERVKSLKVVYSKEIPLYKPINKINSSISFVPGAAGLIIASEVVKDLIKD